MKKTFCIILLLTAILCSLSPAAVQAATGALRSGLDDTAKSAQLKTGDAAPISAAAAVGKIVGIVLTFLGIIFLILAVYAGMIWMTAGGKAENTKKAKDILITAAIGLAICLMAYQLTAYVIQNIVIQ